MRRNLLVASVCALGVAAVPAVAVAHDGNRDGLPDGWERSHKLSLKHDQSKRDQDHDGLRNKQEHRFGFNPRQSDTDSDGIPDSQENAGTVASFTGGVLTIKLADGSTLAGKVTDKTRLQCRTATPPVAQKSDNGSGGDDEGDDHGDDNGGDNHRGSGTVVNNTSDDHGRGNGNVVSNTNSQNNNHDDGDDNEIDDDDNDDGDFGNGVRCGTEALTVGKIVHEASLQATSAGAVFEEVELVG